MVGKIKNNTGNVGETQAWASPNTFYESRRRKPSLSDLNCAQCPYCLLELQTKPFTLTQSELYNVYGIEQASAVETVLSVCPSCGWWASSLDVKAAVYHGGDLPLDLLFGSSACIAACASSAEATASRLGLTSHELGHHPLAPEEFLAQSGLQILAALQSGIGRLFFVSLESYAVNNLDLLVLVRSRQLELFDLLVGVRKDVGSLSLYLEEEETGRKAVLTGVDPSVFMNAYPRIFTTQSKASSYPLTLIQRRDSSVVHRAL